MKLLIISAMPHHRRDGVLVGWGPTVRELDQLATRFEHVRHIACLHEGPPLASDLAYTAKNIEIVPVAPAGGDGLLGKLDALRASPKYIETILRELPDADFVHVRAPANIALIAMLLVSARKKPIGRWFKYAGNWQPSGSESTAYTLQRWWLNHAWHRGIVTVNGSWPDQPGWVKTFYNPSLDDDALTRGREAARQKQLGSQINLLYVGRVEVPKGAGRAIEIVERLVADGIDAQLQIVGDGPERAGFEQRVNDTRLGDHVHFHGWRSHEELFGFYAKAHVSLLPTTASEGWPKVLSEGMAFGAVPVAGAVSSIPQYLRQLKTGAAIPADDVDSYVTTIASYVSNPESWQRDADRATDAAHLFTFAHYLTCIDELVAEASIVRSR